MKLKIDINKKVSNRSTPFLEACKSRKKAVIKYLIEQYSKILIKVHVNDSEYYLVI